MFSGVWCSRPDDGGTQQLDAVLAQFPRELQRVRALQLVVARVRRFEPHPDPRDAQLHQLAHGVLADGVGRREHVERPGLVALLHEAQQLHGAALVQQEVLVHHEERLHVELALHLGHHVEQLFAGIVEIQVLALAAEERGGGAEVAAHGAAHRGDDGGRGRALGSRAASCPGCARRTRRRSRDG